MDSNKDDTLVLGTSILDLQKQEKEKERKKKQKEQMRKYREKPGVKEKMNKQRQTKELAKKLKKFGRENPHEICQKLGHTIAWSRFNPDYSFKCVTCDVCYSNKESTHFYKGNKCPCCHKMLRTRKTIKQKKSIPLP